MNSQQLREVTVQKLHVSKEICVQIAQLILYSVINVMMGTHWFSFPKIFPKMMKLVTVLILILFIMTYLVSRRVVGNVMMKKLCV